MTRYLTFAILLTCLALLAIFVSGCSNDSFMDPRVAGRPAPAMSNDNLYSQHEIMLGVGGGGWRGSIGWNDGHTVYNPIGIAQDSADEVWFIGREAVMMAGSQTNARGPEGQGGNHGSMTTELTDGRYVHMPLQHTDVDADVAGYVAQVRVTQQFHNPFDEKIEAVYAFPLPQDAAVDQFVMTIGDRTIRGIIREKEEAERLYNEAKRQGYRASLLVQHRPNIFEQKVANIEPGADIDVSIRYFHTLAYRDGEYIFAFPMVVGPRYNPAGKTDGVGAVSRGKPGRSGQDAEVQYLKPDERTGHDIALTVRLNPGTDITTLDSVNHKINRDGNTITLATNTSGGALPNKDFVLRFGVEGERVKTALVTHRDARGAFFTLMVHPPAELETLDDLPAEALEMIFVLDCSGSMNGRPIEQAKSALTYALKQLGPDDTFQVIRFSNNASALGDEPIRATPDNIRKAMRYVDELEGSGGTEMIEGIKAALDFPHEAGRSRYVCFMTDGYIGNETDILLAIHERLRDARIFSFGVGLSPNRFLMNRMAKMGRGVEAYLALEDDPQPVMDGFLKRVRHPALTQLQLDFGAMKPTAMYPRNLPDLFVGSPVTVTGRFAGELPKRVTVRGRSGGADGEPIEMTVEVEQTAEHEALASVWARMRIAELFEQQVAIGDVDGELAGAIKQLALDYNLMSAYTSFVAVDASQRTAGTSGVTVAQPVPVPDGVRYDTTVSE